MLDDDYDSSGDADSCTTSDSENDPLSGVLNYLGRGTNKKKYHQGEPWASFHFVSVVINVQHSFSWPGFIIDYSLFSFVANGSGLCHCWLGDRKGIQPVNRVLLLVCWWWQFDWSSAHLTAPVVTTTSIILSSNNIQNGDILVPANLGCLGKMAVKRVSFVVVKAVDINSLFCDRLITASVISYHGVFNQQSTLSTFKFKISQSIAHALLLLTCPLRIGGWVGLSAHTL